MARLLLYLSIRHEIHALATAIAGASHKKMICDQKTSQEVSMTDINVADAKAKLSQLLDMVEAGESIDIKRHGKPVARLVPATASRKPIDIEALRKLTDSMPMQSQGAGEFVREMRDSDRY
jgi:prevent-host-death family protein